mmetsp:Transcript_34881/g.97903  ORF Transcript_34881/g.97903 Transcript_34881/m.97903 type:complete len:230 (-) Transcript_34881:126-815(-)
MGFVNITMFFPVDPPMSDSARAETDAEDTPAWVDDMPCESYLYDFYRSIDNVDFVDLPSARAHGGASGGNAPTVRGKVAWRSSAASCAEEWRGAQRFSPAADVHYTLPGPLTIINALRNEYYEEERELAEDLAAIINVQVRALVSAGCRSIHIEEPALSQEFEKTRTWGIEVVGRCVDGVAGGCELSINSGCGYYTNCDEDRLKSYLDELARVARGMNASCSYTTSIQL